MLHYIGKDRVTQGSTLILDRKEALKRLRSRAKQGFRKAERAGVVMEESRDLSLMAKVWYDPATLPQSLRDDQKMYVARIDGELAGAIIVTPISPNTLFYHFGGTSELGRLHEVNAYMFWHIVEQFDGSRYRFLDVGVSYRRDLQHYFQKYCTHPYPIIFRPPGDTLLPKISFQPFHTGHLSWSAGPMLPINTLLLEFLGTEFTYMPSSEYAILSALKALDIKPGGKVAVFSSMPESSPSPIILRALDRYCQWTKKVDKNVKAILVDHRFGIPYGQIEEVLNHGLPVIEISLGSLDSSVGDQRVGSFGDLAVFDFTQIFPMQFGAILTGRYFEDQEVWDRFGCLDVDKRNEVREQLGIHWQSRPEINTRRRELWSEYLDLFHLVGMEPIHQLDDNTYPSAFVFRTLSQYPPKAIQERLERFGISVEIDEREGWVALPCHQLITPQHRDYIFGAYRGMMNPCVDYIRPPSQ
jgi:hypothetical protein